MTNFPSVHPDGCEQFPTPPRSTPVTDELNRIVGLLRDIVPSDATISFDFNGKLQVHIDLARREDVTLVEALLPRVGAGLFQDLRRSSTPHRPFSHRVSAVMNS
jgi:hypothetical protein